ncbi:hypothetical protein LCGC14_1358860 [marine sediment metagenome]|uniref:Uncharacterized protein n=1 Tax=marine sediment metagenome TaxID=412755 RepID=A0A0F9K9A3_9ZZZZ
MTKQTMLQKANQSMQEAFRMYEECERCRKLAMNKYNWRNSQANWAFADTYRLLGHWFNHDAQKYYGMAQS